MYLQLVAPNPNAQDVPGACLRMVQTVFGNLNPYYYRSAFHAWLYAEYKHYDRDFPPDTAVILHFNHWGEYNDGLGQYGHDPSRPYLGNWGHIVVRFPNGAILSSPGAGGVGQEWFTAIEQVVARYGGSYLGWTEDVGGLRVVQPVQAPAPAPIPEPQRKVKKMFIVFYAHAAGRDKGRYLVVGAPKFRLLSSEANARSIAKQLDIDWGDIIKCQNDAAFESFCLMAGK